MLPVASDLELAERVEARMKEGMIALVRKFHLAGWVSERSLSLPQLWETVRRSIEDERSGFFLSLECQNTADLVMNEIDVLRDPGKFGDRLLVWASRKEIKRHSNAVVEEIEEVLESDARPKTRYHEPLSYDVLYFLPIVFVYLEWRSLPPVWPDVVLVASAVVALAHFLLRYYSRGWFFRRIPDQGFRVYPGP